MLYLLASNSILISQKTIMKKSPALLFLVYAAAVTVLQIILSYALGTFFHFSGYFLSMIFNFLISPIVYLLALHSVYKNDTGEKGAGHVFWGALIFMGVGIAAGFIFFLIQSQGYDYSIIDWLVFMIPQYLSWIAIMLVYALIASMWRLFKKAGQPGWACIVPIYNYIVLLRVVGKPWWWFFLLCIPIVNIVIIIIIYHHLSLSFGKGGGFTAGLVLLGIIFFPILAFGDSKYVGPGRKAT